MTQHLKPEIAVALEALASARGLSAEEYLEHLLEKEMSHDLADAPASEGSGMVWEDGLFVYRTGKGLPLNEVNSAIRRVREQRAKHILGDRS